MNELTILYEEAIKVCDEWRSKRPIAKATPNELHVYNVFTGAKRELQQQLACIKDVLGTYNQREK